MGGLLAHFHLEQYSSNDFMWLAIGFIGQTLFFGRFLVQWIVSEREKRSVVPPIFWYFSIVGGAITFFYALHRQDIVFTLGQGIGLFVYTRNLMLLKLNKKAAA